MNFWIYFWAFEHIFLAFECISEFSTNYWTSENLFELSNRFLSFQTFFGSFRICLGAFEYFLSFRTYFELSNMLFELPNIFCLSFRIFPEAKPYTLAGNTQSGPQIHLKVLGLYIVNVCLSWKSILPLVRAPQWPKFDLGSTWNFQNFRWPFSLNTEVLDTFVLQWDDTTSRPSAYQFYCVMYWSKIRRSPFSVQFSSITSS